MKSVLLLGLFLTVPSLCAKMPVPKVKPLSYAQMVQLGWRPTPTTAQVKKKGNFVGHSTIGAAPQTLALK